jgi:hypothetical protein
MIDYAPLVSTITAQKLKVRASDRARSIPRRATF